jgi:hypothetical protein
MTEPGAPLSLPPMIAPGRLVRPASGRSPTACTAVASVFEPIASLFLVLPLEVADLAPAHLTLGCHAVTPTSPERMP